MTSTATDEYNGWTNRETWAAALHLSNDEGLYREAVELVAGAGSEFLAAEAVEEWVKGMVETVLYPEPGETPSKLVLMMVGDVGSFWRVDWPAVASSFDEGQ